MLEAAREVFVRDGYARTSVDEIAALAGVSKKTIYNNHGDKESLFLAVIRFSAGAVGDALLDVTRHHLGAITAGTPDVAAAIRAYARAWLDAAVLNPEHGALVLLMMAESRHFSALTTVWEESGPGPVRAEMVAQFGRLANEGVLDVADPGLAARLFNAMITTPVNGRSYFGAMEVAPEVVERLLDEGVWAFMRVFGTNR